MTSGQENIFLALSLTTCTRTNVSGVGSTILVLVATVTVFTLTIRTDVFYGNEDYAYYAGLYYRL